MPDRRSTAQSSRLNGLCASRSFIQHAVRTWLNLHSNISCPHPPPPPKINECSILRHSCYLISNLFLSSLEKMVFNSSLIRPSLFVFIFVLLLGLLLQWTWLHSQFSFSNPLSVSTTPHVTNHRTGISYRGTLVKDVEHFQNIFYAEDTSGPNRFAPPRSYLPPPGSVVDATAAGAVCPQGMGPAPLPFASPITNVSENCLSLRIARPSGVDASAKLPVLVWIHGGIAMTR